MRFREIMTLSVIVVGGSVQVDVPGEQVILGTGENRVFADELRKELQKPSATGRFVSYNATNGTLVVTRRESQEHITFAIGKDVKDAERRKDAPKEGERKDKDSDGKRTGTIIGELKARKDTKDSRNSMIEVLAPGEEKARSYFVNYDPAIKGPLPKVLEAVRAAKIGDRVEFEWVATNHGPAITKFKVLPKRSEK